MSDSAEVLQTLQQAVLDGDDLKAPEAAEEAIAAGVKAIEVIDRACVPGVREAGRLWQEGEYFLPELVAAAQAMTAAMKVLQQHLLADGAEQETLGRVVIGTVEGDIHDIGKTLVATLLTANGFTVADEGADVPIARLVERAREIGAEVICASALLTTTMSQQAKLVAAVKEANLAAKVMVGGAPVTEEWAEEIGADGYADNAVSAVSVAKQLVAS